MPARAGEGRRLAAHGDAQPGDLGQATADHRRPGVVAHAETLRDAGGDGHYVLQRPAELAADHVVVDVNPEQPALHDGLQGPGHGEVLGRDDAGRGLPGHDLLGQVRPGESGRGMARQLVPDELRHAQQRTALEALRQADDRNPRPQVRPDLGEDGPEPVRGYADDQQVDVVNGLLQVRRGLQVGRQREPGQVARVGVALVDLPGQFGIARPDGAIVMARHQGRHRGAPRPGPEYCDPHARPLTLGSAWPSG